MFKFKLLMVISSLILLLTGCTQRILDKTEFHTDVSILAYNDIAQNYTEMATSGSIGKYEDGTLRYTLSAPRFGNGFFWVSLPKENVDKAVSLIEKYKSWNDIAIRDGDVINKEIGKISFPGGSSNYTFRFSSGSKYKHFMIIDRCFSDSDCLTMGAFDINGAKHLSRELKMFKNGSLTYNKKEESDKYK